MRQNRKTKRKLKYANCLLPLGGGDDTLMPFGGDLGLLPLGAGDLLPLGGDLGLLPLGAGDDLLLPLGTGDLLPIGDGDLLPISDEDLLPLGKLDDLLRPADPLSANLPKVAKPQDE
jgi:hypothetical protein